MAGLAGSVKLIARIPVTTADVCLHETLFFDKTSCIRAHILLLYGEKTTHSRYYRGDHMADEFLTVAEAAHKLGVSPRTIQRYCRQGRLNHRWVSGKRHKELRILPPITLDRLPGVKRKSQINISDYVARKDFEETVSRLERELLKKDLRIDELRHELARMKERFDGVPGDSRTSAPGFPGDETFRERIETVFHEFENVRPTEKRLIVKLAQTLKDHGIFLKSLGYGDKS
jgi:excisionase family DNA binding protein